MTDGAVRLDVEETIAVITLDRPNKLNALTPKMLNDLRTIVDRVDHDHDIRIVLLTAAGDRAFCAGADIDAWSQLSAEDMWRRWIRDGHVVFDGLAQLRQPTIAVIDGIALGGGLELALTADIRVAEHQAKLGLPEVSVGIVPGWAGPDRLVRLIGPSRTKMLALTGDPVDAAEAMRIGLVDVTCETGAGLETARRLATRISSRAPIAVQLTKQIIAAAQGDNRAAALDAMAGAFAINTADCQEGITSFREKRPPDFSMRRDAG